ncbi:MAG: hypothetical protein JRH20_08720, partial [Deltaproteobacteria bacterium]|nr:hypothetical protein [Deltaproteobacteria bacterium]
MSFLIFRSPVTIIHPLLFSFCLSVLSLGGCKKEDVPEHVRQQRQTEKTFKKRKELMKKGKLKHWVGAPHAQEQGEHTHGQSEPPRPLPLEDLDDSKWPKQVKILTLQVKKAHGPAIPGLALRLAQQGPPAFEAMRFLIRQRRQPKHKLAMLGMLLAEAQMFRPLSLAKLSRDAILPYLQRAAIQRLAWLKDKTSQKELHAVKEAEKPMAEFIEQANRQRGPSYTKEQLATLDAVFHGKDAEAVKKTLHTCNDFALEAGLFAILHTQGARRVVKGLVTKRLVTLASSGDRQRLREYVSVRSHPPLIRVAAAQELLQSKSVDDKALLNKLAADAKEPMAPLLRKLLAGKGPN